MCSPYYEGLRNYSKVLSAQKPIIKFFPDYKVLFWASKKTKYYPRLFRSTHLETPILNFFKLNLIFLLGAAWVTVSGSRPSVSIRNEGKSFGRMKTNSHTRKKKETYPIVVQISLWMMFSVFFHPFKQW